MLNRGCRDWNLDDFVYWSDFERDDMLDRRRDDWNVDDLDWFESGHFRDWNLRGFEVNFECDSFLSNL